MQLQQTASAIGMEELPLLTREEVIEAMKASIDIQMASTEEMMKSGMMNP